MSTAKEELTRLIEKQPDSSSSEDIVRELAFHVMVPAKVSWTYLVKDDGTWTSSASSTAR